MMSCAKSKIISGPTNTKFFPVSLQSEQGVTIDPNLTPTKGTVDAILSITSF